MTDERRTPSGFAYILATMPGLWEKLLVDHVADHRGRCRACTTGGTGIPGKRWPCSIHALADAARRLHAHGGRV
ncbi:MAG: hypothetical protein ACRDRH_18330 [Pseudonocardia sp.]